MKETNEIRDLTAEEMEGVTGGSIGHAIWACLWDDYIVVQDPIPVASAESDCR